MRKISNFKFQSSKFSRGFTLIELIIVIAVLSIFSAMAIRILDPAEQFKKANDGRRKSDLSQIQKALEQYYQDNNRYPVSTDGKITMPDPQGTVIAWGTAWQPYMNVLPSDPNSQKNYAYESDVDGQMYYLYASLDRGGKDPQVCHPGQETKCDNAPDSVCGSGVCNYGVTSPNVSP